MHLERSSVDEIVRARDQRPLGEPLEHIHSGRVRHNDQGPKHPACKNWLASRRLAVDSRQAEWLNDAQVRRHVGLEGIGPTE